MIYYTIYKVTNKVNGKIYIGSHKTKDLNDNYMGSGKYLRHAIEKHGIENFVKEILYIFDTPELMYTKEAELVNEDFIAEANTYNLKVGGFGGFDYINKNKLTSYPGRKEKDLKKLKLAREKVSMLEKDPEWRKQRAEKASQGLKQYFKTASGHFSGKKHSEETKEKLSGPKPQSAGMNNSQFGTMWITNGIENKKVKKLDTIPEGWYNGRVLKQHIRV
jgi:group I intron endonuclease